MKGIIFNIAESFIVEHHGEDVFDDIIAECTLETTEPFVGPGTYSDNDMMEILRVTTNKLGVDTNTVLRLLGHYTFGQLASRYPNFVENFTNPKKFLLTVDGIIHVEVRKLYQGTQLPVFQYLDTAEDELTITYYSKRKLYTFMEGLISGVGDYFNTNIAQCHEIFEKDGEEFCNYHLKFS